MAVYPIKSKLVQLRLSDGECLIPGDPEKARHLGRFCSGSSPEITAHAKVLVQFNILPLLPILILSSTLFRRVAEIGETTPTWVWPPRYARDKVSLKLRI